MRGGESRVSEGKGSTGSEERESRKRQGRAKRGSEGRGIRENEDKSGQMRVIKVLMVSGGKV